jgi:4-carboxymuconolactone decarboxylase
LTALRARPCLRPGALGLLLGDPSQSGACFGNRTILCRDFVHASAFGRDVGLSDQQVAATAIGTAADPVWNEDEALLVRMVDELHDTCDVSAETWSRLAARDREDQLLELVITAGWYRLLSTVVNAARIPLEPWAQRFPSR